MKLGLKMKVNFDGRISGSEGRVKGKSDESMVNPWVIILTPPVGAGSRYQRR